MDKWQIDRINELYSQLDRLTEENSRLKHNADTTEMKTKLDQLCQQVQEIKQLLVDDKTVTRKKR